MEKEILLGVDTFLNWLSCLIDFRHAKFTYKIVASDKNIFVCFYLRLFPKSADLVAVGVLSRSEQDWVE